MSVIRAAGTLGTAGTAGTDPAAAERAGRAWAAALFDSGAYGDRWDYCTAFHSDTAWRTLSRRVICT